MHERAPLRRRDARMREHAADAPQIFKRGVTINIGKRRKLAGNPAVQREQFRAGKVE